jgi:antitoxin HicB
VAASQTGTAEAWPNPRMVLQIGAALTLKVLLVDSAIRAGGWTSAGDGIASPGRSHSTGCCLELWIFNWWYVPSGGGPLMDIRGAPPPDVGRLMWCFPGLTASLAGATEVLHTDASDEPSVQAVADTTGLHIRAWSRWPPDRVSREAVLGLADARWRETVGYRAGHADQEGPWTEMNVAEELRSMGSFSASDSTPIDYRVVLERDDNGTVLVTFPDWPEAHTFGETEEEALERAPAALASVIDAYIKARRPLKAPSMGPGPYVPIPSLTVAKMELHDEMLHRKISKSELARRLCAHPPQVDRLLDVHHASRLDQLERAFEALGTRMILAFQRLPASRVHIHRGVGARGRARRISAGVLKSASASLSARTAQAASRAAARKRAPARATVKRQATRKK